MATHLSEEERRAQIINGALQVIYTEGIEGLTLEKIAKAAKCSKGVAAYYFQTKENIILEAYRAFLSHYQQRTAHELSGAKAPTQMLEILMDVAFPKRYAPSEPHKPINLQRFDLDEHQESVLFMQFFGAALNQPALQAIMVSVYAQDAAGIGSLFDYYQQSQGLVPDTGLTNQERAYGFLAMVIGLSFLRVGNVLGNAHAIEGNLTGGPEPMDRRLLQHYLFGLAQGH